MSGREPVDDDEGDRRRKLEEALEVKSLRRIISAYLHYRDAAEEDVKRYEKSFSKLLPCHKALLPHHISKFQRLRRCIYMNAYFISSMLQAFEPPIDMNQDPENSLYSGLEEVQNGYLCSSEENCHSCGSSSPNKRMNDGRIASSHVMEGIANNEEVRINHHHESIKEDPRLVLELKNNEMTKQCNGFNVPSSNVTSSSHTWLDPLFQNNVPLADVDKVRCILRNLVRDWAVEGQREREQCYKPILHELDSLYPHRSKASPPTCLVPGAGLGRLALEISSLGFVSQGNEFSYYMMICSSFILNHTNSALEWTIYPWIHSNCNSLSDTDQLRPVLIPDLHPASAGITEGFSMCGGDFVEVYGDQSQAGFWDAVVTCFFIDTAHNVVEYIEIISTILKDGGVWINLGPLLYHFADMYGQEDDMSIELSLEDVKKVALHYGFEMEKENTIETTYTTNPRSMMQNHYMAAFWTMKKKSQANGRNLLALDD